MIIFGNVGHHFQRTENYHVIVHGWFSLAQPHFVNRLSQHMWMQRVQLLYITGGMSVDVDIKVGLSLSMLTKSYVLCILLTLNRGLVSLSFSYSAIFKQHSIMGATLPNSPILHIDFDLTSILTHRTQSTALQVKRSPIRFPTVKVYCII